MNPGSQFGQEAIANMEIEMMTDLYNRSNTQGTLHPWLISHPLSLVKVIEDLSQEVHPSQVPRG